MDTIQHKIDRYIEDVISGRQKASQLTRLSVERHVRDLANGRDRGLWFDIKAAEKICKFVPLLSHHKGAKARKSFEIMDWQVFYLASLFGWKRENGFRRFGKSYLEIGRKNGKTSLCAVKGLYAAKLDNEAGAQVYFVATKEEQAKIGFNDAKMILKNSPLVAKHFQPLAKSIYIPSDGSFVKPLGSDSDTQDGLDPSYVIVDEYHAHPNDKMLNVMETGMGARRQPMVDIITTAGFNKEYPCFKFRGMIGSLLEDDIQNDAIFGLIYTLDDEEAEWEDPETWVKANPCLGESIYMDRLQDFYKEAKTLKGEKEVEFKTKNLNIWTDAAKTWITTEDWDRCKRDLKLSDFHGMTCYGALDLASTEDFCSFSITFQLDSGDYVRFTWFFIPEETIKRRVKNGLASLKQWVTDGYVIATPGNVTDYAYIEKKVMEVAERFDLQSVAYDRFNSSQLIINLSNEGIVCNPFGQGFVSMSFPTKEYYRLTLKQELLHNGNPVMRWQRGNVALQKDAAENIKPDKQKSKDKIDGIVSEIMSLGECLNAVGHRSTYEENDLLFVKVR